MTQHPLIAVKSISATRHNLLLNGLLHKGSGYCCAAQNTTSVNPDYALRSKTEQN